MHFNILKQNKSFVYISNPVMCPGLWYFWGEGDYLARINVVKCHLQSMLKWWPSSAVHSKMYFFNIRIKSHTVFVLQWILTKSEDIFQANRFGEIIARVKKEGRDKKTWDIKTTGIYSELPPVLQSKGRGERETYHSMCPHLCVLVSRRSLLWGQVCLIFTLRWLCWAKLT